MFFLTYINGRVFNLDLVVHVRNTKRVQRRSTDAVEHLARYEEPVVGRGGGFYTLYGSAVTFRII